MLPKGRDRSTCTFLIQIGIFVSVSLWVSSSVDANCAGYVRPIAEVNREVLQALDTLQEDPRDPVDAKLLGSIAEHRIDLTSVFNDLTVAEKRQFLKRLNLDGSSYRVYTHDGRLLSAQSDGCTRTLLFTERDRFRWYTTRPPLDLPAPELFQALRNAGNPDWRQVNHAIEPEIEHQIRLQFWHHVGFHRYNQGWWIAWVPETGYFEMTVGNPTDRSIIQGFIETAPPGYGYQLVTREGRVVL